jgi:two-component sensor histidine kinase
VSQAGSPLGVMRLVGVLLIAALILLAAVLAVVQFNASREKTEISALRGAHVVATHFDWVFEASSQALRRIGEQIDGTALSATTVRNIEVAARDLPEGYQYSVYNERGDLRYSSLSPVTPVSVTDRDYFKRLAGGEEFVISPQLVERASGEDVFVVGRRLELDGRFIGAATVAIPQAVLEELSELMGATGEVNVSIVGLDGMLISREPPIEPMNLKGTALFDALAERPNGTYETVSPADGVRRIVGYWTVEHWPVVAIAGFSKDAAFRDYWRHFALISLLLLPVVLLFAWLVRRLMTAMDREQARQAELEVANERGAFLLREIHHRVKNNLQTVLSLIRLERLPTETKHNLSLQIEAMVKVHEEMYRSDRFDRVNLQSYLTRVIQGIAASHPVPVDVTLDLAPVEISGDRALQLGILVNEAVSNAYKHAFGPRKAGALHVSLNVREAGQLRLVVRDDGPGYARNETPTNMGTRLIEGYAGQLAGTLTVSTTGRTEVKLDFPLHYGTSEAPDH